MSREMKQVVIYGTIAILVIQIVRDFEEIDGLLRQLKRLG
jgi:hypothetical protein